MTASPRSSMNVPLYHYSCDHGAAGIRKDGKVVPQNSILGHLRCSWWADLAVPDREGLGLTSTLLDCDRTAHRFEATRTAGILPWAAARRHFDPWIADALERTPGAKPRHWWVSFKPVRIEQP